MSGSYFDPLSGYPQIGIFAFFSPINGQRETKIDLKGFATVQSMYGNGSTRECSATIKFHDEISRLLFTLTQISHEFHDVYFTTLTPRGRRLQTNVPRVPEMPRNPQKHGSEEAVGQRVRSSLQSRELHRGEIERTC